MADTTPRDERIVLAKGPYRDILVALLAELERAETKFPDQHLPSGTGDDAWEWPDEFYLMGHVNPADLLAARARALVNRGLENGTANWRQVLTEEVAEAFAERTPERLRAELLEVACVALRWIADLEVQP